MISSPHDAIFKAAFGQPDIARGELELLLPREVATQLDLSTIETVPGSFIDDELQQTHSDLLYKVRTTAGRTALVYVLFEHQSSPDPTMPFRLLRYVVRVWERWLRDHSPPLPVVIPVVLHHGDTAWSAPTDLAAMLDATPELLDAARPFLPLFRFALDDLATKTPSELASRALGALPRLVQLGLWASRSFPRLRDAAPVMRALVATLVRDERTRSLLTQLYVYLLRSAQPDVEAEAVRTILLDVAGPQGEEDVVNAGEQLIQQGQVRALRHGIARVLAARSLPLSEVGRARLDACGDVARLTSWLERAATATSEAEVFAAQ
jgi:hypothetical protein